MSSAIWTIMRKELARFFGDRRTLFALILPGILIYFVYSFMGTAITNQFTSKDPTAVTIEAVNLPAPVASALKSAGLTITDTSDVETAKASIADKDLDLLLVFPSDFDAAVAAYDVESGAPAPNVELYYNTASTDSGTAYDTVVSLLNGYEATMANKFDLNRGDAVYDLASQEDLTGTIFSSMLPFLLMIFLYSGCMAVAPESIAGEKERGTIATLLITPTKRSQIAIGKILALSIMALISGLSSTIGTVLALPKLMGGASDSISTSVYTMQDYLLLAVVILSTVLLIISLISIISAFAKTTKEAQTYMVPLMILVMLVGITGFFGGGAQGVSTFYFIPIYNSVQCMAGIFSFTVSASSVLITVLSNLVYAGLGVFVLTRMFDSERIIYSK